MRVSCDTRRVSAMMYDIFRKRWKRAEQADETEFFKQMYNFSSQWIQFVSSTQVRIG
jgi:hypothetical protein